MRPGNVSQTVWRRSILKQLHTEPERSFLKMSEAEMCMAFPIEGRGNKLVLSADASACGNTASIGYYAVAKALNDLMTRGGEPEAVQVRLGLPASAEEADVRELIKEMQTLCSAHNISLGGIRAEVVPALQEFMVQATAIAAVNEEHLMHLQNAAPGQEIILCGSLALEGMERILEECETELADRFVPAFIRQMKSLKGELVQMEAIRAARGHVSAMQQIGSGGILAALWEVAETANIGLKADLQRMTICQETIEVCEFYRLNPYQMTSTGAILMFTDDGEKLLETLRGCGARAVRLGSATAENARVITSGEEVRFLDRPAADELALWQEKRLSRIGE